MGIKATHSALWALVCLCLVAGAAAAGCGLSVCLVVDASSSINSNASSQVGSVVTWSNNTADTFEKVVRPFLKELAAAIQNASSGTAEFAGVWFGATGDVFQRTMTTNLATLNASIDGIKCPVCYTNCKKSNGAQISNGACGCSGSCTSNIAYTNMDWGVAKCFNSSGGLFTTATPGKPRLVIMITDGVPNRKMQASNISSGTGTNLFAGLQGWPLKNSKPDYTKNTYDCGSGGTTQSFEPPDVFNLNDNGNPMSPCAGNAVGIRAMDMRSKTNKITFISIGVGNDVNDDFLQSFSSNYYPVKGGFADLLNATSGIVGTVCTDVSLRKTASAENSTLGGNVTYTIQLTNTGAFEAPAPGFKDAITDGMTIFLPVTFLNGTPSANCTLNGTSATGMGIQCIWSQKMPKNAVWTVQYLVRADSKGPKVNRATLVNVDGTEDNNVDDHSISIKTSCDDPYGDGKKPYNLTCNSGSTYYGDDDEDKATVMLDSTRIEVDWKTYCCKSFDVAASKSASVAGNVAVGTTFTYSITLTNKGPQAAPKPVKWTDTMPVGVQYVGPVTGTPAGTPAANCTNSTIAGVTTLSCSIASALAVNGTWTYTYTVRAFGAIGPLTNRVSVPRSDTNNTNNNATTTITVVGICANPSGNGSPGSCQQGTVFNNTAASTVLSGPNDFQTKCCQPVDVAVKLTATPNSLLAGGSFSYGIQITNVGPSVSGGNNGFVLQVPAGINFPNATNVVAVGNSPPASCVQITTTNPAGLNISCTINSNLTVNGTWSYSLAATGGNTAGSYTARVDLVQADSNATNNFDTAAVTVRLPVDVAVGITAPQNALLGDNFTYTINMTNVGPSTSPGSNGFTLQLPPNVTLPNGATARPIGAGTPNVTCTVTGLLLNCTAASALASNVTWLFAIDVKPSSTGNLTATVQLTNPDDNPANNQASTWTLVQAPTCANPYGNGPMNCPPGKGYVGPNNKTLNASSDFVAQCCDLLDVGINKVASVAEVNTGSVFTYNVTLSNVGKTDSPAPTGFTDTIPAGLTFVGPVQPLNGAPAMTCQNASSGSGPNLLCYVNAPLPVGANWTYSYSVLAVTPGVLYNKVELLYADGNSTNDNSTAAVTVLGLCGNPYGNGTNPGQAGCGPGLVYNGPDNKTIPANSTFISSCCVNPGSLPGDGSVTISPNCTSYGTGKELKMKVTVTSNGPGTLNETTVAISFLPDGSQLATDVLSLVNFTVYDPANSSVNYNNSCIEDFANNNGIGCTFVDLVPNAQAVVEMTFKTLAAGNVSVTADFVNLNDPSIQPLPPIDLNPNNDQALSCINVVACPIFQEYVNGTCQPVLCNPCADPNPTVYVSTGNGAKPSNGLWQIRNFAVGNMALVPEFLCTMNGLTQQIGDIAVLHKGDIVLLDTNGGLFYIPAETLPAPNTNWDTSKCTIKPLYKFPISLPGLYSGLSTGFRSDMLFATTGAGHIYPLILNVTSAGIEAAPLPGTTQDAIIQYNCWYNGSAANLGVNNTGGTDLTPGPDGNYYRWCAQDRGMQYTGTRFNTTMRDGYPQVTGTTGSFVSYRLGNQTDPLNPWISNAGAFCTDKYVVGTGAYVRDRISNVLNPTSGTYTQFYAYGVVNGVQSPGYGFDIITNSEPSQVLGRAPLISRTITVLNTDGTARTGALRINGAAVKARCPVA